MTKRNLINILLAFALGYLVSVMTEASREIQLGLGLFTCIAWLWITEALHVSVTALLVPLLASLLGLLSVKASLINFSNPVIYLFMGGFALAAVLQKYGADRMFAVRVLRLSRGNPLFATIMLFLATALLSMWISNTATVAMMLPLALGLLEGREPDKEPGLFLFVLLGLAYAGNIGGMTTLIGSPPNAIAASAMGLDFRGWLTFGIPAFLLLFPLMIVILLFLIRPSFGATLTLSDGDHPPTKGRGLALTIFGLTATGWVLSAPLSSALGVTASFDTLIAIGAIVLLIGTGCLEFREFAAKVNWGILLLFGGGLTLSTVLQETGASAFLADAIVGVLPIDNEFLVLLILCLFVIFLTELVSNTASAALLVPLFVTVAAGFGYEQTNMAVMVAICASCAFMLPVATPPNALVFASGYVQQRQMMRTGLVLNISFAFVMALLFRLL